MMDIPQCMLRVGSESGRNGVPASFKEAPAFPNLRVLSLPVEVHSLDSYLAVWEAVEEYPALRQLALWIRGTSERLRGGKLARFRRLIASLDLEDLEITVCGLQESLAAIDWPMCLRSLRVSGQEFNEGAADACCEKFAARVRTARIVDLHVDCWHGLSELGLQMLLTHLANSELKSLKISWDMPPTTSNWLSLAYFLQTATTLRELAPEWPGEDWQYCTEFLHLEALGHKLGVDVSRPGLELVQEVQVDFI